jgi:hypothetical protein
MVLNMEEPVSVPSTEVKPLPFDGGGATMTGGGGAEVKRPGLDREGRGAADDWVTGANDDGAVPVVGFELVRLEDE